VEVKGYKRRYYPFGSALTHVIGYVSKINDKDVDRLDKDGKLANYAATHDIGKLGIALLRRCPARTDRLRRG
jgi:penicillin-binding protein 2